MHMNDYNLNCRYLNKNDMSTHIKLSHFYNEHYTCIDYNDNKDSKLNVSKNRLSYPIVHMY